MNIGINGFGRIGRLTLRSALLNYPDANIVAVNTSGSMNMQDWAMLFKYDTAYGVFPKKIEIKTTKNSQQIGSIVVEGTEIPFLAIRNPEEIPWKDYNAKIILESTGVFRTKEKAELHLKGGAKLVIISAPPKDDNVPLCMLGINENNGKNATVISNCSCTTYSSAPVIQTIVDRFGFVKGSLTTIHAYTSDQRLIDGSHKKDIRRARSAANNIIPTSSGAGIALSKIIPELFGKFESMAIRVPVMTGSISNITILLPNNTTVKAVNDAFKNEASGKLKGILDTTTDPLVSSDIIGSSASAIVDLSLTKIIDGTLLNVYSWYDNEWSYACRLIELALRS